MGNCLNSHSCIQPASFTICIDAHTGFLRDPQPQQQHHPSAEKPLPHANSPIRPWHSPLNDIYSTINSCCRYNIFALWGSIPSPRLFSYNISQWKTVCTRTPARWIWIATMTFAILALESHFVLRHTAIAILINFVERSPFLACDHPNYSPWVTTHKPMCAKFCPVNPPR